MKKPVQNLVSKISKTQSDIREIQISALAELFQNPSNPPSREFDLSPIAHLLESMATINWDATSIASLCLRTTDIFTNIHNLGPSKAKLQDIVEYLLHAKEFGSRDDRHLKGFEANAEKFGQDVINRSINIRRAIIRGIRYLFEQGWLLEESVAYILHTQSNPFSASVQRSELIITSLGERRLQEFRHIPDVRTSASVAGRSEAVETKNATPWMKIDEAAAFLGVKPGTVRNWVSKRYVPFARRGRVVRFHRERLNQWMQSRETRGRKKTAAD